MFTDFFKNNLQCNDALESILEPLKVHFGIDIFWYGSLDENGHFYNICSHIDLFESGWENECYKKVPYLIAPENLLSGYFYLDFDQKFQEALTPLEKNLTAYNSFMILRKKSPKTAQFFGFAAKTYNPHLASFYCNNVDILNKYVDYFLSEMTKKRSLQDRAMVDLKSLRKKEYLNARYNGNTIVQNQGLTDLLQKMGMSKQLLNASKGLSPREKQVLNALVDKQTASETGGQLGLSHRTVQFYLENTKNKLGLYSRAELAECATLLKMAGYL